MLRSWDIFDTLITRRCVSPKGIFVIVEGISKIKDFVSARIAAERNASLRGNYNFDDIYREFQRLTSISDELRDKLKKLELDVEFVQSIPITENIRRVKAGDVLISDMYLPENFIRRLLDKAGLIVPVEIVITSNGKSSGYIWKQFANRDEFVFHIGDNPNGDIKNPRLAGLESALTLLSNPNQIERYLLQKDFNFGAYLREIRLRNPYFDEIKRLYWQLFTANVGLLILLVQQIDLLREKYGFEYLGFCGRDTYYLRLLYEKYKLERGETPVPNDYLYYSRKLVQHSEEEMAKYFTKKIANRKALMIDLVGSGTHLNYLRGKFNFDYSLLICFYNGKESGRSYFANDERPKNWIVYLEEAIFSREDRLNICFLDLKSPKLFFPNDSIENLNRAPHNSPVKLKTVQLGEKLLPEILFSENNDTENLDVMEACFNEVLKSGLVTSLCISEDNTLPKEILSDLLKAIATCLVPIPLRDRHQLLEEVDTLTRSIIQRK